MLLARTAFLIALLLGSLLGAAPRADVIEQILLKVNGEIFTKTQLEARQVTTLRQMQRTFDPATDPTGAELRKALDEITPRLLVAVVDEILMEQRGKELGYTLSDTQFQTILDTVKKDNNLASDEQLRAALESERMTLDDFRRTVERSMIVQRVQQNEIIGRIAVSEEEARRYHETHQDEFTTPASVTLREIFITIPGDGATINVAADEAARAKAEDIRRRAAAGESFETLASTLSDSPSKANGGLVGPLQLTEVAPALRTRIEAMKPGDVTEILRSPRGYQLLKLETLTPAQTMPFEQAREDINSRVFTGRRQQEFQAFVQRLRDQAIIEWKNEEIRKAYDAGLKQIASQPQGN